MCLGTRHDLADYQDKLQQSEPLFGWNDRTDFRVSWTNTIKFHKEKLLSARSLKCWPDQRPESDF